MIIAARLFYSSILSFLYFAQDVTYGFKLVNDLNIVGGHIAKEGEYPYQAGIFYRWDDGSIDFHCGASILDEHHVLTAAHCLDEPSLNLHRFFIGVGVLNRTDYKNMIVKEIKRLHVHKHFELKTVKNDIALIKIKGSFKFNKHLKPIELTDTHVKEGTICSISGWGNLKEATRSSPELLRGAAVPISNQAQCVKDYKLNLKVVDLKLMICAGYEQGGVDACQGDSGGPMVCNNKLEGVVSWGHGCARNGYPGVYTRVHTYLDWIQKHVQRNSVDEDDKLILD